MEGFCIAEKFSAKVRKSAQFENVSMRQCKDYAFKNYVRGFRPCNPDFLFVLKQKGSKKFKAMSASLKKLAFAKLNCPNLLLPVVRSFEQWAILRLSPLFFGSPYEAVPNLTSVFENKEPVFY
jgi:hypothetical protein